MGGVRNIIEAPVSAIGRLFGVDSKITRSQREVAHVDAEFLKKAKPKKTIHFVTDNLQEVFEALAQYSKKGGI